jgi:hypothetical protein
MSCIIKDGKYYDNNGNESKLYQDLVERVGEQEAHNLFVLSHTPTFKSQTQTEQEPSVKEVLKYVEDNFSLAEPLTKEEILDLSTLQLDVENSEELYDLLYDTFYVDGLFSPQKNLKKLKKLYSETEIRNILQDVTIQARIKETVEKLRFTEPFNITQIDNTNPYYYKELLVNTIGQYKSSISEPKEGVEVDVVDENNEPVENKLFYPNAIKEVKNTKIFQAIDAIIAAPKNLTKEIEKVQKKVEGWLLDHGMDIRNLSIDNYPTLKNYLREVKEEDAIELESALGFERSPKRETVKIDTPLNRTYKYLRTTKTEQELFDQYSLIKTNTPNVYHQIEKIEEQEIRDIQDNQDLTVPVYEIYKDYYGYNEGISEGVNEGVNLIFEGVNINEDFVADFAVEKLKKPNEFNELFKITENGIELINDDTLTIAKVKSQIANYPKMADYVKISKILSIYNFLPAEKTTETKENRRIKLINNKQFILSPKTEIEIIDNQFIKAPNETEEFLKIGNNIFEQQEAGVYSKLEFQENPNYFTLKVEAPQYREFEQKLEKPTETKVKKLTSKEIDEENFGCL